MKTTTTITIKQYHGAGQWFLINESGNAVCNHGFANVDAAIEWADEHYPEANTSVDKGGR